MEHIFTQLKPYLQSVYVYTINHPQTLLKVLAFWFTICGMMEWISRLNKRKSFFYLLWKVVIAIFFGGCLVMFFYVTLGNRYPSAEEKYRFDLFWSYKEVIYHNNQFILWQIIWNILAFVPMGNAVFYLLGSNRKFYKVILYMGAFSLGIEAAQLYFKMGLFEFDDIWHNTLGAVCGYMIAACFSMIGNLGSFVLKRGRRKFLK